MISIRFALRRVACLCFLAVMAAAAPRAAEMSDRDNEPAFYIAGPDSTLAISVDDALLRIKKVVGPEDSPWIGPGPLAYRYDGPGMAADKPALLFSFGADSREKFTAERHFAVDEEGKVFEMDIPGGGEYWEWEENGVSWWGDYRRGDAVLNINNYREGPYGLYFVFAFTVGNETAFEGTAPVRGRTARYGQLVFAIAKGDGSVEVTFDPEAAGDEKTPSGLEGVYERF